MKSPWNAVFTAIWVTSTRDWLPEELPVQIISSVQLTKHTLQHESTKDLTISPTKHRWALRLNTLWRVGAIGIYWETR